MPKLSAVTENHDDAEAQVKFLRMELAEMEKLSEQRLKLAKAELFMIRKRLASAVIPSVVPLPSSSNKSSGKKQRVLKQEEKKEDEVVKKAKVVRKQNASSSNRSSQKKQDPKHTEFQFKGDRDSAYGCHIYGDPKERIMDTSLPSVEPLPSSSNKSSEKKQEEEVLEDELVKKVSNEDNIDIPEEENVVIHNSIVPAKSLNKFKVVKDTMEKEEDRIYEWIKRFVSTGPNREIRPFNLNDLMEENKTFKLHAVEDIINQFLDEGKILINIEHSSKRVLKYDLNQMYEMISIIDEVPKHQTSSNP